VFKRLSALKDTFHNRQNAIETDLAPLQNVLAAVKKIRLDALSDCQLKEMARQLKREAQRGAALDDLLGEAFALVREVSRRLLGITAFDVQIMAAVALHQGKLVEMQTGEGKTWAAVLPAFLNGLAGKGVHVLTFNDYLVYRDHAWMGPIYHFLGLTTAYIQEGMSIEARRKAYAADIT
jgi:preprotein translocase subunit SecA